MHQCSVDAFVSKVKVILQNVRYSIQIGRFTLHFRCKVFLHSSSLKVVDAFFLNVLINKLLEVRVLVLFDVVAVEISKSNWFRAFILNDFFTLNISLTLLSSFLVIYFQTFSGFINFNHRTFHPLGNFSGSQVLFETQHHHLLLFLHVLALALTQITFLCDKLVKWRALLKLSLNFSQVWWFTTLKLI